jgi:Icc-related predicted phosphoesterase
VKKVIRRVFWVIFVLSLIELPPFSVSGVHRDFTYKDYNDIDELVNPNNAIAIIGDLQRTSLWELMMGREQNDAEREKIVNEVSRENPSMLILLGDLVYDGGSRDQWDYFDRLMEPVNEFPVLTVLGNHEYYSTRKDATPDFVKERFSQFSSSTWYTRTYGNLAFIFLDSNEKKMSTSRWIEQQIWLSEMLETYDKDPQIKGIVVFAHHPPFTNSLVTGDEKNVQKAFVPSFMGSVKTMAFISGHAHTYEHLKKEGKYFIVSGGGGGPRVFLNKAKDRHEDDCNHLGIRPFHYMLMQPGDESIEFVIKGINKGESQFKLVDSFNVEYSGEQLSVTNDQ